MAKRGRSARGEVVDFDLISIKSQLAEAPKPIEVNSRREYIDTKEGSNKKRKTAAVAPVAAPADEFENSNADVAVPESVMKATQDAPASGDDFLIPVVEDNNDVAAIEASVNQPKKTTKKTPRKKSTK